MEMMTKVLLSLVLISFSCQKSGTQTLPPGPGFHSEPELFILKPFGIRETSGIADSKTRPGHLWVQEDSGNPTRLFLLGHDGNIADSVYIKGVSNRDWEEMQLCDGQVYIGEIGDNNRVYGEYSFYRFPEPLPDQDTVLEVSRITFTYPDGSHDAEAFLVEPATKDIYIITKREEKSRVYRLSSPYSNGTGNQAQFVMELPYTGVVAAALSPDSREIIIKTYGSLYYYTKNGGESISAALEKKGLTLGYKQEAQGEAISFGMDNKGFFTLSEKAFNIIPPLCFYRRK